MRTYIYLLVVALLAAQSALSYAKPETQKPGDFVLSFLSIYADKNRRIEAIKFISRDYFEQAGIDPLFVKINSYPDQEYKVAALCNQYVDIHAYHHNAGSRLLRFKVVEESGRLAILPFSQTVQDGDYLSPWWQNVEGHLVMPDSDCKC